MANEENCRVFSVFRPKSGTPLDYYIAKFDANSSVDFKNGTARMERENNFKEFKSIYGTDTDMPTSGAGSEYGREKREEAKRKKFGFKARQYDPKSQPFILKMGAGKDVKKMKGTKNGGITKNAGYLAFVLTPQKHFISLPVSDWFNFAPVSKRATLSIEEAEEQFSKRDKIYNHFAIMSDKKNGKREDDEDFEGKPAKRQKRNRSENEIETLSDSDEERDSDDDADNRKNKKRKRNEKSDDFETVEVGDDEGVDEGKELDYLSDDSDDEDPLDEDMDDGRDDDNEEEAQLADDKSDDDDDDEENSDIDGEKKDDSDSDSDEDIDGLFGGTSGVKENIVKDNTPVNGKRKSDSPESASKKPKLEAHPVSSAIENMEDFIRDCLKEPTSTSQLMMKVLSQFSKSLPKKELQQNLILIMKKLNPKSRNIEGAKHFFL